MTEVACLQDIKARALSLTHLLGPSLTGSSPVSFASPSTAPNNCSLPPPPPIVSSLLAKGLSPAFADRLAQIYYKQANALRKRYEEKWKIAVSAQLSLPSYGPALPSLQSAFSLRYMQALRGLFDATISSSAKYITALLQPSEDNAEDSVKQTTFNQDAIRILEAAFTHNTYPSRHEKLRIAGRTAMSYKQINIWFQNRRTRSKKEARGNLKLSIMPQDVASLSLPCDKVALSLSPAESARPATPSDPFQVQPAAHAFPSPYPPICDYDPFPIMHRDLRLEVPWPRRNIVRSINRNPPPLVDGLMNTLSQLTIEDALEQPAVNRNLSGSRLQPHSSPCCPFIVYPTTAPLPALTLDTVSTFPPYGPNARLSRLTSNFATREAHSKKADLLLHRTPQLKTTRVHGITHPYLLPPPLSRQSLRSSRLSPTSSLSSLCSDSSSSMDSPPATPPQLLVDLPHIAELATSACMLGSHRDLDRSFTLSPASSKPYDGFYLNALAW